MADSRQMAVAFPESREQKCEIGVSKLEDLGGKLFFSRVLSALGDEIGERNDLVSRPTSPPELRQLSCDGNVIVRRERRKRTPALDRQQRVFGRCNDFPAKRRA